MFKCQVCGIQVPRGVPSKKVVTEIRDRVYSRVWIRAPNTERNKARGAWRSLPRKLDGGKRDGKPRLIEMLVPEHVGWEIVTERRACPACAGKHRFPQPKRCVA
jgi:hypothetical protein